MLESQGQQASKAVQQPLVTMRLSCIMLVAAAILFTGWDVVSGASEADFAVETHPDLVQALDNRQPKREERRFLRNRDTVEDDTEEERGFVDSFNKADDILTNMVKTKSSNPVRDVADLQVLKQIEWSIDDLLFNAFKSMDKDKRITPASLRRMLDADNDLLPEAKIHLLSQYTKYYGFAHG
ncbi:unnamed protein product [Phytophthora lilii]|uniref:RxLR effector protein n=1 Tax=Phytophthora lilii TaxID=2077276 RepID=A0A9W6U132_9STRA|nr:unnamed protein product [Phytophthora lilii]